MAANQSVLPVCWICGKALSLEECKVDEHGQAVHEECSVELLSKYTKFADKLRIVKDGQKS
jgi:hypothetical protein